MISKILGISTFTIESAALNCKDWLRSVQAFSRAVPVAFEKAFENENALSELEFIVKSQLAISADMEERCADMKSELDRDTISVALKGLENTEIQVSVSAFADSLLREQISKVEKELEAVDQKIKLTEIQIGKQNVENHPLTVPKVDKSSNDNLSNYKAFSPPSTGESKQKAHPNSSVTVEPEQTQTQQEKEMLIYEAQNELHFGEMERFYLQLSQSREQLSEEIRAEEEKRLQTDHNIQQSRKNRAEYPANLSRSQSMGDISGESIPQEERSGMRRSQSMGDISKFSEYELRARQSDDAQSDAQSDDESEWSEDEDTEEEEPETEPTVPRETRFRGLTRRFKRVFKKNDSQKKEKDEEQSDVLRPQESGQNAASKPRTKFSMPKFSLASKQSKKAKEIPQDSRTVPELVEQLNTEPKQTSRFRGTQPHNFFKRSSQKKESKRLWKLPQITFGNKKTKTKAEDIPQVSVDATRDDGDVINV